MIKSAFYLAQSHDKHLCTLVVQRCFRVLYTIIVSLPEGYGLRSPSQEASTCAA